MIKRVKNILYAITLLLDIAGIVFIVISMLQDGNNAFLIAGLCCIAVGQLIIHVVIRIFLDRKAKKETGDND